MSDSDFRVAVIAALRGVSALAEVVGDRPTRVGTYPYVKVSWGVSDSELWKGDARTLFSREEFQVSIWERSDREDGTVKRAVIDALDGQMMGDRRVSFSSAQRIEEDGDLVHTPITFRHRTPFTS